MLLNMPQKSQENTCVGFSISIKLQAWGLKLFQKETPTQVFSCGFWYSLWTPFLQNTSGQLFLNIGLPYFDLVEKISPNWFLVQKRNFTNLIFSTTWSFTKIRPGILQIRPLCPPSSVEMNKSYWLFLRSKSRSFSKFFYSPSRSLIPSLHSFQGTLFNWKIPFNKFQSIFSNSNNWIRDLYMFLIPLHKKMKFSIKNFFSKCDQIRRKLRIWSHLLKKSLTENFIFRAV